MMKNVIWATPLYEFLKQCQASPLEKIVLDCGAGGEQPPLSLFYDFGFRTYGLEIAQDSLSQASKFCRENTMPLNIFKADMRRIPFKNESFSFIYSFNAIIFLTKKDIARTIAEFHRVMKPDGLCYVNVHSVDDPDKTPFCKTSFVCQLLKNERFAHFEDDEADDYFTKFKIIRKTKSIIEKATKQGTLKQAYIEYFAQKK
ncbi:class I SAM-dependent methyltransferase [candidate division CSSED10-310 bacterium]|uniref:Class I SAM-dependent methyltransferase n=1 Tax=candidate division CSSED10-310 bacterium TaxID=2855610 RepID=A0ABV6YZP2_UNCC1